MTGTRSVAPERLAAIRSAAQLLHRPAGHRHPADVAREICGAQAQDPYAGRLAFRARSGRLRADDVDRARSEERSIVRTWVMRGTMHLLAADDVPWLAPLFEDAIAANSRRRLAQLGVPPAAQERGLRAIQRSLDGAGPVTRDVLVERIERTGTSVDASRRVHFFFLAVTTGIACLGPDAGGRTTLVDARDWLGERPPHDRDAALAELARRYLRAFGPATEADFAGWAGLPLRDVRAGLRRIERELTAVRIGDAPAWALASAGRRARRGIVRLLPGWDTYLMGHRDRDFIAAPPDWRRIMPGGGLLRAAILVDGVAVGPWSLRRGGAGIRVELAPFRDLAPETMDAIRAEVADVGRFEGRSAELVGA